MHHRLELAMTLVGKPDVRFVLRAIGTSFITDDALTLRVPTTAASASCGR
jgi:hypothetical protein